MADRVSNSPTAAPPQLLFHLRHRLIPLDAMAPMDRASKGRALLWTIMVVYVLVTSWNFLHLDTDRNFRLSKGLNSTATVSTADSQYGNTPHDLLHVDVVVLLSNYKTGVRLGRTLITIGTDYICSSWSHRSTHSPSSRCRPRRSASRTPSRGRRTYTCILPKCLPRSHPRLATDKTRLFCAITTTCCGF